MSRPTAQCYSSSVRKINTFYVVSGNVQLLDLFIARMIKEGLFVYGAENLIPRGGYGFFCEKKIVQQILENK